MQSQSKMLVNRIKDTLRLGHTPKEVSIGVDSSLFIRASDRAMLVSREVSRELERIGIDCKAIAVVPQWESPIYSVVVHNPRMLETAGS